MQVSRNTCKDRTNSARSVLEHVILIKVQNTEQMYVRAVNFYEDFTLKFHILNMWNPYVKLKHFICEIVHI